MRTKKKTGLVVAGMVLAAATVACTLAGKVTAGGWIEVEGGKGTFGVTARGNASGAPIGNVTYQDHGAMDRTVKSTAVTSVKVNGNCAEILGVAKVNGNPGFGFKVDVCDNGEPGKDNDTFHIEMLDYLAGGPLGGGNVQIHKSAASPPPFDINQW